MSTLFDKVSFVQPIYVDVDVYERVPHDSRIIGSTNKYQGTTRIDTQLTYINNSNVTVRVLQRDGVSFTLSPSNNVTRSESRFVIRRDYNLTYGVKTNLSDILNKDPLYGEKLNNFMLDKVPPPNSSYRPKPFIEREWAKEMSHYLDAVIDIEELCRKKTIYVKQYDVVLSVLDENYDLFHPYHQTGTKAAMCFGDKLQGDRRGFGYYFIFVDNQGIHKSRFINLFGEVIEIKPIIDATKADGFHALVKQGSSVPNAPTDEGEYEYYMTIEEASERFKLYETYADASTHGDSRAEEKRLKKKLAEYELSMERLEKEFELKKFEQETKMHNSQAKILEALADQKIKQEAQISELENLKMTDHYQRRSLERKESSEMVKFLPSVIMGFFAMVALWSKLAS